MKLAFCTEDLADQELLLAFLRRLTDQPIEAHEQHFRVERGGWTKALNLAPIVARAVFRSTADGAVFAIDNDAAEPLHDTTHQSVADCRHCALRAAARVDEVRSWDRPELAPLKFLFVVPVRTIETWLCLCHGSLNAQDPLHYGRSAAERQHLKRLAYGTERPDQLLMQRRGREIIENADLSQLKSLSPSFAQFAADAAAL